jgi:AcrR family transcriptional regulator
MLHHYPTKAALVAGAIEQLFSERHSEFRSYLADKVGATRRARSPGPRELEPAVAALWRIYTGKTFYAWAELLIASRTDPDLRSQLRKVDDRFFSQAVLTCTALLHLEDAPEPEVCALTRLLLSVLDGLALNHALGGRDQIAGDVLATLPGLLARG